METITIIKDLKKIDWKYGMPTGFGKINQIEAEAERRGWDLAESYYKTIISGIIDKYENPPTE